MSVMLALAAFVTVVGALVAVATRDARRAVAGLVVALVAAPFVAEPLPAPILLAVRVVAALLGGYLVYLVMDRAGRATRGSFVSLPAEALVAAAAFVIGAGAGELAGAPVGPPLAIGAGLALVTLSVAPIARGDDVIRLTLGLTVLVAGVELVRVGLAGTPAPLEELLIAALILTVLTAGALLAAGALAASGSSTLHEPPRVEGIFEAHPVAAAELAERTGGSQRMGRVARAGRAVRRPDAHRERDVEVRDPKTAPPEARPTVADMDEGVKPEGASVAPGGAPPMTADAPSVADGPAAREAPTAEDAEPARDPSSAAAAPSAGDEAPPVDDRSGSHQ